MPNNFNMNYLSQMYQMFSNSKNPMDLISQLAKNNPQYKPILDALNKGMSPQSIFETMCKQRGINANEFIKQLQGK